MNIEPLFQTIIEWNGKESVWEEIQEAKSEYLDEHWEEEFEDVDEAYSETGRGEAENQILTGLINQVTHGYPIIDSDHCRLFDMLANHYELNTE